MSLRERVLVLAEKHSLDAPAIIALAVMRLTLEAAAQECETYSDDKWAQYKGRPPYEPMNAHRADAHTQGESCGAADCALAIRKLGGEE